MAMIRTHTSDALYVSAIHARNVVRLRIGPSELGKARIAELKPAEARRIALFLLQSAEKVGEGKRSR
jgi:hypothetical protein